MAYKKKKRGAPIVVMTILIVLSIAIVLAVYAISSGIITLPGDEDTPVSVSEDTSSEEPPPEPPKLTYNDAAGSGIGGKISELENMLNKYPFSVSLYYYDLSTGNEIEFNSLKKYLTGSVIKAPYCKWLISSGADLTEVLTLSEGNILEGAGTLKDKPIGTQSTVQELIEMAIVGSDNTAYKSLLDRFGADGYNEYAKGLGVAAGISASNPFGLMSAAGAGILFSDIYTYGNSGNEGADILLGYLKNTSYNELISKAVDVPVAHKYGYNNGNSGFHDAAIVYSDKPYILTIFSTMNPDKDGTTDYIRNLAAEIDKIHS